MNHTRRILRDGCRRPSCFDRSAAVTGDKPYGIVARRFATSGSIIVIVLVSLAVALGGIVGCSAPTSGRVTGTVSDAVRTPLPGTAPFAALAQADLGALAGETQLSDMILLLQPSGEQSLALADLLAAQVDPASPLFHRWLTPDEFGARFGVADEDLQAVTSWLEAHGFIVSEIPAGRRAVVFSGTAAQLGQAFGTELHRYRVDGQVRIANQGPPRVPSALAPVIRGLLSMNDAPRLASHRDLGTFQLDRSKGIVTPLTGSSFALDVTAGAGATNGLAPQFTTTIGTATYHIVAPYDFATIYNLTPLWNQGIDGTGQTIAIVSRSDLDLGDVDKFRANFGLPAAKVNKIFANANPGVTPDVAETALDVEWSGAVAKGATIDLVIASSTLTTDGVDLSALYIVNNNVAPVLSISYGLCEFGLGQDGNAFYNTLWQQAAAQGQTVFVASGDAGSTTCNQGWSYSTMGLSVNGLGSTPYNVAVGGTDLYGSYAATAAYWSPTNDPATLASALGYVPEIPWNDSCGNPVLLSVLQANKGYTDASTAELCNDSKVTTANFRNVVGGGGGASNCVITTDGTIGTCTGGYPRPSWQAGPGVPSDNARYVPDVSLFAGDGLWGSFYPYCVSSQTQSGLCDLSMSTNVQGAGGTSFASPAFAGIMALINQKTAAIQGNANPVFYRLAATQSPLDCSVETIVDASSCIYHDVDLGGNATACFHYGGAKDCTVSATANIWGVVDGNAATRGYDPAIGLGSVNITNLVNSWSQVGAALSATTATLTLDTTSTTYGAGPTATVVVSSTEGTPTGSFTVLASGLSGRLDSDLQGELSDGSGTVTLALLPAGTYPITAHYAGDGSFAASDSAAQTITVAKAPTTVQVASSRTDVTATRASLLTLTIAGSGSGAPPTGSVTVTNTTTGAVLGTFAVVQTSVAASSRLSVDVAGTDLIAGANTLTLSYTGDSNYAASTATQSLSFDAPFSAALSPSSLTVNTAGAATAATATLTVSPATGSALAYPITLSCHGALPSGASCLLSTTVLNEPSTTATVTVGFDPALASQDAPAEPARHAQLPMAGFAGLAAMAMIFGGRRRLSGSRTAAGLVLAVSTFQLTSCSADGSTAAATATSSIVLSASSGAISAGSSLMLRSTLTASGGDRGALGTVTVMDSYRGSSRSLGSAAVDDTGSAALTVTTLGLGMHSMTAVFGGDGVYPAASSSAVAVAVSATATLQIQATDANGYTVAVPLAVTLQ